MKETFLKDIDLRKRKTINYLYNTNKCKVIDLCLDIKHPQISMSRDGCITVEGHLPTSYKDYDKYEVGLIMQDIYYFKGYEVVGLMSDKYTLVLTLLKDE